MTADRPAEPSRGQHIRFTSGASVSPDATGFAHLVDDGGYPWAVQRFLTGRHGSTDRRVELPVPGPVTKIVHSADSGWLACQVAPHAGNRTQVWVVRTDPLDRSARRVGARDAVSAELIGWDGNRVALTATDEEGVAEARLVDPQTQEAVTLDRRVGSFLVDSWAGAALLRVGPRGHRELLLQRDDGTRIPLLPSDFGSTTDMGVLLDDHRLLGVLGRYRSPWASSEGEPDQYIRALVRSDNGAEFARLLGVAVSAEGVSYRVLAERDYCGLDEFVVSDDHTTVALLWNYKGLSELQILHLADGTLDSPIQLPGLVASELSISADGSLLAVTVEGPGMPPSVEIVDPRTGEWGPVEPARTRIARADAPILAEFTARDGLPLTGWLYRAAGEGPGPVMLWFHGGPELQERPGYSDYFPALVQAGITVFAPNVRGSGGFGRTFVHADERYGRFAGIDDVADCVRYVVDNGVADPARIACAGHSYGGYLTLAALTFHPDLFATGIAVCGMSNLETFYANTEPWIAAAAYPKYGHPEHDRELLAELSPIHRVDALTAPVLVVHGAHDTNVPVSESEQVVASVRARGGVAELLLFDDEGHDIVKRENRDALAEKMVTWLTSRLARSDAPVSAM
ncbi:alpha/beta hydrolase family protein [Prescottella equi]|uniref:Alpha/beta fold hydrolase n=1 Tax=Rhodococcus hoagii TaxID=43767 RepID=A0A9Q5RQI0_RHOHA|nr:alpha/beta fold hydrolase [Prescottella equi]MBM4490050.1 alpha/beta fold hydrolase [Prescottella equi]MBM4501129.1 alpha/beta fold hydrolase [Prescottella equi]MBM4502880.1 alpha/beta fold hydrolase [Prescottella equi]MBM4512113.1 alpha/beta fold hydrolase [Prescottella equi]MBM4548179.1 alpha/beta fold hydrolase [Prescottella equi]